MEELTDLFCLPIKTVNLVTALAAKPPVHSVGGEFDLKKTFLLNN